MAQKNYQFEEIDDMEYVAWYVTAQMKNKGTVTISGLKEGEKKYFSKWPVGSDVCIGQGYSEKVKGQRLSVNIEVAGSGIAMKNLDRKQIITDANNKPVAFVFIYSLEDGHDQDFNDITVYISAWKSKPI